MNNYNTFSLSFYFLYMIVNHFLGRKKDYAFIQKKMLQKILKWIQLLFLPCSILNIEKNRTVQSIGVVEPMVVQLVCLLSLFLCSNRNLLYRSGFTFGLCCSCLFELQTHTATNQPLCGGTFVILDIKILGLEYYYLLSVFKFYAFNVFCTCVLELLSFLLLCGSWLMNMMLDIHGIWIVNFIKSYNSIHNFKIYLQHPSLCHENLKSNTLNS